LMEWILNGQDGIDGSAISALAETLERRDVKLATPPQLRVTYLTAWPVGNSVAFRRDVYGLDGTGFTVGQPLPEGELSADGQRYVLKPVPRKAAAVDAAEAEGFSLFGSRSSKTVKRKPGQGLFTSSNEDGVGSPTPKKLPFGVKKQTSTSQGSIIVKPGEPRKLVKKASSGLFDWASYRKEQKSKLKAPKVVSEKPLKKKPNIKKVESPTEIATPAKKLDEKTVKKVAAADVSDVKKPVDAPKKPAVVACKPGVDCKVPAAKKPDIKKVVATP
jgi:L,D-transpeptidase YcbB